MGANARGWPDNRPAMLFIRLNRLHASCRRHHSSPPATAPPAGTAPIGPNAPQLGHSWISFRLTQTKGKVSESSQNRGAKGYPSARFCPNSQRSAHVLFRNEKRCAASCPCDTWGKHAIAARAGWDCFRFRPEAPRLTKGCTGPSRGRQAPDPAAPERNQSRPLCRIVARAKGNRRAESVDCGGIVPMVEGSGATAGPLSGRGPGRPGGLVPVGRLELPRCCHRRILNPLRLPFRHTGRRFRSSPRPRPRQRARAQSRSAEKVSQAAMSAAS